MSATFPPGSRVVAVLAAAALALGTLTMSAGGAAAKPPKPAPGKPKPAPTGLVGSTLYVNPLSSTLEAAQSLTGQARADAQLLASFPSATWFTSGTPTEVRKEVHAVVTAAAKAGKMPVLVAYNLPFRDCAQYSAGGALDTAAYKAWIDGFAAGIGNRPATVILEPDGVGIIPHYTTLDNNTEWCQPAELDPATAASERYVQLNHAVDALKAKPKVSVYLDGTSSAWLNVGEVSDRLIKAGVQRADGFYLNASNYQFTTNQVVFGTWVSQCIAYASVVQPYVPGAPGSPGAFGECGNQYWNGGPATDWQGVAMSPYGEWTPDNADPALNTTGVDSRYASQLGSVVPTTHFVIDTSRNGLGPWQYPVGEYPAHEDWCNPPDRGLGARPTTTTGIDLVDALLWIKVPGESDGNCYRGTAGPLDPARGIEDPDAGQWFAVQARELIELANPPVAPLTCDVKVISKKLGKKGFVSLLTVRNLGTEKLKPWQLSWTAPEGQKSVKVAGMKVKQSGDTVVVSPRKARATLKPGARVTLVVAGKGSPGAAWQYLLNGRACTSR